MRLEAGAAPERLSRTARALFGGASRRVLAAAALGAMALALGGEALAKPGSLPALPGHAPPPKAAPPPVVDDGLGPKDVYLEADQMADDRDNHLVSADGHAIARYQGRTIRADHIVYDTVSGAAHARGNVSILNADGTSQYGQDVELDNQLRSGVALGFAARLQDNVTIVAGAAIRRSETVNQLNSAEYTACNICKPNGQPKAPTFSIRASRIVQDQDHHVVYYQNTVIKVLGVPVLYSPVFWHPDPTADRRSGLLVPRLEISKRRGFSFEQPFYWAISPYADLTVAPQLNSRVNPFLDLRYRERFYSGEIDLRAGYTYEQDFDNHAFYGKSTNRSYILGTGSFNIDRHWRWGFGAERVTDPTFFRRYSVRDVFSDRGPYSADTDRLISQLYSVRQDSNTYVSVAAASFQSLRVYVRDANGNLIRESEHAFPVVAPLIEARYAPERLVLGGRLDVKASAVALNRDALVQNVIDPQGLTTPGPLLPSGATNGQPAVAYTDSDRASLEANWRATLTTPQGLRLSPFLKARGDAYSISDLGTVALVGGRLTSVGARTQATTRGYGTVGAEVSYPLIRGAGTSSIILEPIVQILASPREKPTASIPNEDSVAYVFDETNLFSDNRFPGYDRIEGGVRANVGGRLSAYWGGGRTASVTLGRVFRDRAETQFDPRSGLRGPSSDWIVAVSASPLPGLSFYSRSRLDSGDLSVRREEAGLNVSSGRLNLGAHYIYDEFGLVPASPVNGVFTASNIGKVESADVTAALSLTRHWGVEAIATRDLQLQIWPQAQFGLVYQDECVRLDLLYTHDETYRATIGSSDAVTVRLTLATLGGTPSERPKAGVR